VCGVGANCMVHNWWGHGFVVDDGSHSWHVHPSTKIVVLLGWDGGGNRHVYIWSIVHIVGGWGLWSRLPLSGIGSIGGLVLLVLLAYP
jgi:hypothetical protein